MMKNVEVNSLEELIKGYEEIKDRALKLLEDNTEWIDRYNGYMEKLKKINPEKHGEKMHISENLHIYTSISKYLNNEYDLRYKGHSIASVKINKEVKIRLKNNKASSKILFKGIDLPNEFLWISPEGTKFRKHFEQDISIDTEREHQVESAILAAFRNRSTELKYIQPIAFNNDFRYQFPTPFKASSIKDDNLEYSQSKGGGIDILARTGRGPNSIINVIELKDRQNNYELKKEAPHIVIKQAIIYATFIYELLRNERIKSNQDWYSLVFGINSSIPQKLKIHAVVAIPQSEPKSENNTYEFAKQIIKLRKDKDDIIELHYIYYDYYNISKNIKTSLYTK